MPEEVPLIDKAEIVRDTLKKRYRGAIPVTDEMVQAVLAGLEADARVKRAAQLGAADAAAGKAQTVAEALMADLGETSATTEDNWGDRLRMLEAYQTAYDQSPLNPCDAQRAGGGRDGYPAG